MAANSLPPPEHRTVSTGKNPLAEWRANFLAGLAVILPAAVSIGVVVWLFGTVSNLTDTLLFFLPRALTHEGNGEGPVLFRWSLAALFLVIFLIIVVGRFARFYFGKKLIQLVDVIFRHVPLLNKIYGALKQINEAFTSNKTSSFKQVVLVEFPRPRLYSVGFLTGAARGEMQDKTKPHVVGVFVPTTPNPTTGFIVLVPEEDVIKLEMSVADGIKFIMSLGSVSPAYASHENGLEAVVVTDSTRPGIVRDGEARGNVASGTLSSTPIIPSEKTHARC
ncbi:MAG: DUF502 domain-containing protein [Verrucomicrobia bacterium]|nr:DUF502 domain-containing protein [Verrucomicrobiota bacterium]